MDLDKNEYIAIGLYSNAEDAFESRRIIEALDLYKKAESIFSLAKRTSWVARCHSRMGRCLYLLNRSQLSLEYFENAKNFLWMAKSYSLTSDELEERASCDEDIGHVFNGIGEYNKAIEHYLRAREFFLQMTYVERAARCKAAIGLAKMNLAAVTEIDNANFLLHQALKDLDCAIGEFEFRRSCSSMNDMKKRLLERNIDIYKIAIFCCFRMGHLAQALNYFDRSCARTLVETIRTNLFPDAHEIGEELYTLYCNLRSQANEHGLSLVPTEYLDEMSQVVEIANGKKKSLFDSLVYHIVDICPDSTFSRHIKAAEAHSSLSISELVDLLPDNYSCLLEFLTWAEDGKLSAFLVTKQNGLELIRFSPTSLGDLKALWNKWTKMYDQSIGTDEKAQIVWDTCHQLYSLIFGAEAEIAQEGDKDTLVISKRGRLIDYLDDTIPNKKGTSRRMYLVPHSYLFLMPLHAACTSENIQIEIMSSSDGLTDEKLWNQPHYLLEDFLILYYPSAYLLKISRDIKMLQIQKPRALIVGNPQPVFNLPPLPFAIDEARIVQRELIDAGWDVDMLMREEATKQRFLYGDENRKVLGIKKGIYNHLHLAQHAGLEGKPLHSYLYFACESQDVAKKEYLCFDNEVAAAQLQKVESVIAAACLTSVMNPEQNEYEGMAAAFLQAGVTTFIGTLYPLSDEGSTQLMRELYRLRFKEGLTWGVALRQAQLHMSKATATLINQSTREETMNEKKMELLEHSLNKNPEIDLNHPYHWAAFTISGRE